MEGWCRLCFGRYHGRPAAADSKEIVEHGSSATQSDRLQDTEKDGSPPLLSIISRIDQVVHTVANRQKIFMGTKFCYLAR